MTEQTDVLEGSDVPLGVDPEALGRFLQQQGLSQGRALAVELISGGKSNLTFSVTDGSGRWILRRPPLGTYSRGAHDVAREYRVMEALRDTDVPVPRVRLSCEDADVIGAPFYLMDEVDGVVLRRRDQVARIGEQDRADLGLALVDTLAALHEVSYAAVGLSGLGRPDGYLTRQIDRWERQFFAVTDRDPVMAREIVAALRRSQPATHSSSIVHGDFRIDNVMVDRERPGTILAVLDWEMATLGDPLADLGMLAMFWDEPGRPFNPITGGLTAFPGFGSVSRLVERYAERRQLDVGQIGWYLCFSQFKLAVILEQIHVRHTAGLSLGDGFDGVDRMVDQLLNEAHAASRSLGGDALVR